MFHCPKKITISKISFSFSLIFLVNKLANIHSKAKKKKKRSLQNVQTQMGEVVVTVVATTLKPRSPAKSISNK